MSATTRNYSMKVDLPEAFEIVILKVSGIGYNGLKKIKEEHSMQAIKKIIRADELKQLIEIPKSFGEMVELVILPYSSDSDKMDWDWDPDNIEFTRAQHKMNFTSIEKEFGCEDINKWQQ